MAEITLAKALKVKNRLAGRLAKVQADIQAYNSVPAGQISFNEATAAAGTADATWTLGAADVNGVRFVAANRGVTASTQARPFHRSR